MDTLAPIENRIYHIRGQSVMLDRDLAALYGVPTKVLKQAVKRNIERFPPDFMFELGLGELKSLRSQIVTLNDESGLIQQNLRSQFVTSSLTGSYGGARYSSYAFTEQCFLAC